MLLYGGSVVSSNSKKIPGSKHHLAEAFSVWSLHGLRMSVWLPPKDKEHPHVLSGLG